MAKKSSEGGGIAIGLPKKVSMLVFVITAALAAVLRLRQLFYNVNFNTGRYINKELSLPVAVIVIGMVLCAVIVLFGVAKDKVVDDCILINPWRLRYDRLDKKMPMAAGIASLVMSLLLIVEIIANFVTQVMKNKEIKDAMDEVEARYFSLFTGIGLHDWITTVLMVLVLLVFITMGMNIVKKDGISRANCAAMSCYAAWKVYEIFHMFSVNSVIATDSSLVYDLLTDMCSVVFFLSVARVFMGMEKKSTRVVMTLTGYMTSILAAVSVLPRYALLLIPTGYDDRLGMELPAITDIALIFLPAAIVAVFWTTYTYREMPKGEAQGKRWTLNARPKDPGMDDLDTGNTDTDSI